MYHLNEKDLNRTTQIVFIFQGLSNMPAVHNICTALTYYLSVLQGSPQREVYKPSRKEILKAKPILIKKIFFFR